MLYLYYIKKNTLDRSVEGQLRSFPVDTSVEVVDDRVIWWLIKGELQFNTFQPRQELQLKIFPVDTSYVVGFIAELCGR